MGRLMFTNRDFRDAAAYFPTGVSVITARAADNSFVGVTANSFSSISANPPLLSVSLDKSLRSFGHFVAASHFAINILGGDQQEVSSAFARTGCDKWAYVESHLGPAGSPLIRPNIAAFECESYARYEGGDHLIFLGRVMHIEVTGKSDPLVFFRSRYRRLAEEALVVSAANQND